MNIWNRTRSTPARAGALALALALAGCTGSKGAADQQTLGAGQGAPDPAAEGQAAVQPAVPRLRLWRAEGTPVVPTRYRAELQIDPESPTFQGRAWVHVDVSEPVDQIWLNATDLEVSKVSLTAAGETWPVAPFQVESEDFLGFPTGKTVPAGEAVIELEYQGVLYDKDYSGLFRQQDDDGNWYVYSHMEPLSARRVFPSFDEPIYKVPWQLSLTVKEGHMALANTPETASAPGPAAGWKTVTFAESKPLPTYLVALAVGPFEAVDIGNIGRNRVPARVIVPKGRSAEARYAVEITPALLNRLEHYFDRPYPYAKLDSIAVLKFGGAMENAGLITYADELLLATRDEETVGFKRAYASVGAHELAHQWFGNLVTLAWWDDIWLNESFATWMASKIVTEFRPEWDGEVWAVRGAGSAMNADSLATARRIRQPIESNHDIVGAFDAITYNKGGAVLTMFERWVGKDAFRDGVRAYLSRHEWRTATAADFLASIAEVSKPEVAEAFETFLQQPGVPLVSASLSCDRGEKPTVSLSQSRFLPAGSRGSEGERWQFPVCVKYGGRNDVREQCALMTDERMELALDEARECPRWVLANADAAGYYRVAYGDGMLPALFGAAARRLTIPERIAVIRDTEALVDTGKISIGDALSLVPALVKERDHHLVSSAASIAQIDQDMIPAELRPRYARFIRKTFGKRARALGWKHGPRDSDETKQLRNRLVPLVANAGQDPVLIARATELATAWIETRKGIDEDLVTSAIITAARNGDAALHARFAAAVAEAKVADERRRLLLGMGATVDPELVKKNLEYFLSSDLDIRESGALLNVALGRPEVRQIAYDFIKANWDAVSEKLPRQFRAYLLGVAGAFCDDAHLQDAVEFFGPKAPDLLGGPKVYAQTIERVELCIAYRAAQQPNLIAFLRKQ